MSALTNFLKLFKLNPQTDGNDTFNLDTALNDNWDKVDAAVSELDTTKLDKSAVGVPGGVPSLGEDGKVKSSELPEIDLSSKADVTALAQEITDRQAADNNLQVIFNDVLVLKASLDSPTFLGTPRSTMPPISDNSTRIATTSYVNAYNKNAFSVGSYNGTYWSGASNKNVLSFSTLPKLLLITQYHPKASYQGTTWNAIRNSIGIISPRLKIGYSIIFYDANTGTPSMNKLNVSWSGNSVYWYYDVESQGAKQLNDTSHPDYLYDYIAIL